ncbi:MAG: hypothetical protein AAB397_02965 [Patescibacteria group bacterium]
MFLRIIKSSVFIIISVVILGGGFFAGIYSRDYYKGWQDRQAVRNLMKSYEQAQKDEEARKMADTYGGKTPQETLQMFIDAVEKGDYELASKYFVEGKREEWRLIMEQFDEDSLDWFLNKMLKNAKDGGNLTEKLFYTIKSVADLGKDINYSSIDFVFYSNNIWKINNIEPKDF